MGSNIARKPAGTQHHEEGAVGVVMGDVILPNERHEGEWRRRHNGLSL